MRNKQADQVKQLKDEELYRALIMTQMLLLLIASVLGFFIFDDIKEFFSLFDFYDSAIILVGIPAGLIVVIYDLISMKYLPQSFFDDGGINKRIFSSLNGRQIVLVVLIVSVVELFKHMLG